MFRVSMQPFSCLPIFSMVITSHPAEYQYSFFKIVYRENRPSQMRWKLYLSYVAVGLFAGQRFIFPNFQTAPNRKHNTTWRDIMHPLLTLSSSDGKVHIPNVHIPQLTAWLRSVDRIVLVEEWGKRATQSRTKNRQVLGDHLCYRKTSLLPKIL